VRFLESSLMRNAGRYRIRRSLSPVSQGNIEVTLTLPGAFGRRLVSEPEKHCLMRAFDRMFTQGDSRTGKIGALVLADPARGGIKCLASFALTTWTRKQGILGGHRFVLFPSWRAGSNTLAFVNSSGNSVLFDAHHITFEPNKDGTVNCHATGVDRAKKLSINRRLEVEDDRILLCQVLVQDHQSLDPVGQIRKTVPCFSDRGRVIREWRESFKKNFPRDHMLLIPPNLTNDRKRDVVMVDMYLSNKAISSPQKGTYPGVVFSTLPTQSAKAIPRKHYLINIWPSLNLSVDVTRLDGTLRSKVMWAFES